MADETLKQVGETLEWTSQAAGSQTTKKGVVMAIVPGIDVQNVVACDLFVTANKASGAAVPRSRVRAQRFAKNARYLVRVDREGKAPLWYAPLVKTIDNGLLAHQPRGK